MRVDEVCGVPQASWWVSGVRKRRHAFLPGLTAFLCGVEISSAGWGEGGVCPPEVVDQIHDASLFDRMDLTSRAHRSTCARCRSALMEVAKMVSLGEVFVVVADDEVVE